jgi:hypothetical protein
MADILQDAYGDILITNNSPAIITGLQEIAQRVTQRLRTFYGEWFLDQTVGVKYFQEILKKNPNETLRDALLRDEISNTPGVTSIESFQFTVDSATRQGTLAFRAKTIEGNLETEVQIP